MQVRYSLPLVMLLFSGFMLIGCDDDDGIIAPVSSGGRIEGYVTDGKPWLSEMHVSYESLFGANPSFTIDCEVDSSGFFHMSVPQGKAHLELQARYMYRSTYYSSSDAVVLTQDNIDIFNIHSGTVRADFELSCAQIRMTVPDAFPKEETNLELMVEGRILSSRRGIAHGDTLFFDFRMMRPGVYDMELNLSDRYERLPLADLWGLSDDSDVELTAGHETLCTLTIPEPVMLTGSVSGSWQELGFSRPSIGVFWGETEEDYYVQSADDDGVFVLSDYFHRPVRLKVGIGSYGQWIGGDDFASATVFDLSSGVDVTGIEFVESGLSCELTNGSEFESSRIRHRLYDLTGQQYHHSNESVGYSRPEQFGIANLKPGTYYLFIEPAHGDALWLPRFYGGVKTLAEATPIVIEPGGKTTSISMSLLAGGQIQGTLITSAGDCPYYHDIEFWVAPADCDVSEIYKTHCWTYDWDTGAFSLNSLEDGFYRIGVRYIDGAVNWYPGVEILADADELTITGHNTVDDIDFTL
jgi:hypothetical protein